MRPPPKKVNRKIHPKIAEQKNRCFFGVFKVVLLNFDVWVKDFKVFDPRFGFPFTSCPYSTPCIQKLSNKSKKNMCIFEDFRVGISSFLPPNPSRIFPKPPIQFFPTLPNSLCKMYAFGILQWFSLISRSG